MIKARIESVLAAIAAVLAVVTALWPTWIESLLGVEPDGGSGELEWLVVAALAAAAVVLALLARRDLRIARRSLPADSG
jgi:hypothetical protein